MTKNNWTKCKLGDVCYPVSNTYNLAKRKEIIFINTGDILEGKFLKNTYEATEQLPGQAKKAIEKDDILFSEIRPENGRYALVDFDAKEYVVSTKLMVIRAKPIIWNIYLYKLLTNKYAVKEFQHIAESRSGTFPQITFDAISHYPVSLPPLEEQKRIAGVLGAFDDKIELLQKQNKTLEDMAKAIFKSWFVDFDIVKAKASLPLPPMGEMTKGGQYSIRKYTPYMKAFARSMRKNPTRQENKLWQAIRKKRFGVGFRRQYPVDNKYIADFACIKNRLIIEVDGGQHNESFKDTIRTFYLRSKDFRVLRFWNNEVDNNFDECIAVILAALERDIPPSAWKATSPSNGEGLTVLPPTGEITKGETWTKEKIISEYKITEELYNLFPSSFTDAPASSIGPIPTGWEVKNVEDILALSIGGGWGKDVQDEEFSTPAFVIRGTDIPSIKSGNFKEVPFRYHKESNYKSRILKDTDVIIEVAGGSKGQPVGRALLVTGGLLSKVQPAICASFCRLIRINKNVLLPEIFYFFLDRMYSTGEIEQYQVQSTGISNFQFSQFLKDKYFTIPPVELQKSFGEIINKVLEKIDNNKKQIQTLTELRDGLLPRLLSGKLQV